MTETQDVQTVESFMKALITAIGGEASRYIYKTTPLKTKVGGGTNLALA